MEYESQLITSFRLRQDKQNQAASSLLGTNMIGYAHSDLAGSIKSINNIILLSFSQIPA